MATDMEVAKFLFNGRERDQNSPGSRAGSIANVPMGNTTIRYGTVSTASESNGLYSVSVLMEDTGETVYTDTTTPVEVGDRVAVFRSGQNVVIYSVTQIVNSIGDAVSSVDTEFALGKSETEAPTSGWQTDPPSDDGGGYVWQRVKTTLKSGKVTYSSPVCLSAASVVGVQSSEVAYAVSASGTSAPSTGWQHTVPSVPKGRYLWSRITTTYTDGSTEVMYSVSYMGTDGQMGGDGVGIQSSDVSYQVSSSGTVVPTGNWTSSVPSVPEGRYLWTRTIFTYTDGDSTTTYSVSRSGENGAPGEDGNGIASVTISYAYGTSGSTPPGSGWQSSVPQASKGQYLWIRTVTSYTKGGSDTAYSVSYLGEDGQMGGDGVGVSGTAVTYQTSSSGTTPPTGAWASSIPSVQPGDYLWTRVVTSYTNGDSTTSYSVSRQGVGIERIQEQYYLSTSSTTVTGGSWVTECPEWQEGRYIWQRSRITWEDGRTTYTTAILSTALNQANEGVARTNWHFWADSEGVHVTEMEHSVSSGANALLNGGEVLFRNGTTDLARYSSDTIDLGLDSGFSEITLLQRMFAIRARDLGAAFSNANYLSIQPYDYGSSYVTRGINIQIDDETYLLVGDSSEQGQRAAILRTSGNARLQGGGDCYVVAGDHVILDANDVVFRAAAIHKPGVTIGSNSFIGMNSSNQVLPAMSSAMGNSSYDSYDSANPFLHIYNSGNYIYVKVPCAAYGSDATTVPVEVSGYARAQGINGSNFGFEVHLSHHEGDASWSNPYGKTVGSTIVTSPAYVSASVTPCIVNLQQRAYSGSSYDLYRFWCEARVSSGQGDLTQWRLTVKAV